MRGARPPARASAIKAPNAPLTTTVKLNTSRLGTHSAMARLADAQKTIRIASTTAIQSKRNVEETRRAVSGLSVIGLALADKMRTRRWRCSVQ